MSAFKNILLIGATGSIGSVVLAALEKEPSFTITLLQRASSKATMPAHLETITIKDTYPEDELIAAFTGQDVIVNCITSLSVGDQYRMIDAAIAAKVRRYVPSEYGLDNMRPEAQSLNHVFREKGEIQTYLRDKASKDEIEWMSISCGMWIKWSAHHDFLGMHINEKRFVKWDDGEGVFSCSTEDNTALAVVNALKAGDQFKNTNLFLSDFAITQNQLFDAIERIQGVKYTVEHIDSYKFVDEKKKAVENGDKYATYDLIETGFITGRYGGHFEKDGQVYNGSLGLPRASLDEQVTIALKSVGAI
ncbi:hypothetical protein H072_6663 [Dactylellina haptotyla CBS 200.50]|uniref:NmrA-like domain-containing protein n=1 Tax=Dactylellina haptotyla (strain CBS 200.50) TaxID=1284197 RepID=S8AEI1_DACHA|nr:hypothetical protein H072_6663 [Dactylellina haptotyla CBS 200.50]